MFGDGRRYKVLCSDSRIYESHSTSERTTIEVDEDTIAILVEQQEATWLNHENQEKRFSNLFQQLSRISNNDSTNNGNHNAHQFSHYEEMHEEAFDTNPCGGDRIFSWGIKLDFLHFFCLNPLAWIYRAN